MRVPLSTSIRVRTSDISLRPDRDLPANGDAMNSDGYVEISEEVSILAEFNSHYFPSLLLCR